MLYDLKDEQWERIKDTLPGKEGDRGRKAQEIHSSNYEVKYEHLFLLNTINGVIPVWNHRLRGNVQKSIRVKLRPNIAPFKLVCYIYFSGNFDLRACPQTKKV